MKSLLALFISTVSSCCLFAQDCKGYYYLSNSEVQMTTYDKKGTESGKITYFIKPVSNNAGAVTAAFTSEMVDEKGKSLSKAAGVYKCSNGALFIDAKAAIPGDQLSPYKDMEVKAADVFIEYPAAVTEGQLLPDVNFKMEMYSKSTLHSTITLEQTNRKVDGKETITSTAGSWDCWKISYDGKFKATVAPVNIGIPFNFQVTEWYAPGFGIVKTETRSKNGKLMGTSVITAFKK